ncbi:MAG: precorrin-8X methylmutase [Deltaproteobacteria bacterium]|nr:precorrin-8X methylmutase [Deltaproteobacteria bacterium]
MNAAWQLGPEEIERRSFAAIDQEAGAHPWPDPQWSVVRRLVHTAADFDYVRETIISPGAVEAGIEALRGGSPVVTDTRMALNGISRRRLAPWGTEIFCFIDHEETAARAQAGQTTRSQAAVDTALRQIDPKEKGIIWAVGNAPTALWHLLALLEDGKAPRPALILGFPVGFVNAREAKVQLDLQKPAPYLTNISRKGGSNIAAAAVNALACLAGR